MRTVKTTHIFIALILTLQTTGCSIEKIAADNMASVLVKTKTKFNRSKIPLAARQAAPGLLVTLDGILAASPENQDLLLLKAELMASFAFGFIEDEYKALMRDYEEQKAKPLLAWANDLYLESRSAAKKVIELREDGLLSTLETGSAEAIKKALDEEFDEDDVAPVFWLGFSWGAYINLNREKGSDVTKDISRTKALMEWVVEKDESYYNGGAHLFLAIFNLALGKSIGGRPDIAKKHLDAVDRITKNRSLMSKVLYAEFYLPQIQTPEGKVTAEQRKKKAKEVWDEFIKVLEDVMKAKDDMWPEQALINAVAKEKAEGLYYRADDILVPPPGAKIPEREGEDDEDEEDEE